jgi:ribonucleoside-diphosphate reductase alpha chain
VTSDTQSGLAIERQLTIRGVDPFDQVEWETRDAVLGDPANPSWEQRDVEVPKAWSQTATNIVAQKYFRGPLGSPERERSARQMIGRVVDTITVWGWSDGYFASEQDRDAFHDELTHILLHQMAAFNSPVWFNVGFEENPQCSACFILSCEDSFEGPNGISAWQDKEMKIFLGGSGSGVNLSRVRASTESLSKGGKASGPVSFMRGADSWAGTIKSGGKTRRAAKMVVLESDHPDIRDFVWCKAKEERKAQLLAKAGVAGGMDGEVLTSIQYQNANNSVRVTDSFMAMATGQSRDGDSPSWPLINRRDGSIAEWIDARQLLREISQAAWECADPGMQFDTTINKWHTTPNSGRINASNPCSEYMHVDDSACNLASINLLKFRKAPGIFDVELFEHVVDVMFLAQEIVVSRSSYPTEQIAKNANDFRQLGLGWANLGAYAMSEGHPYDSDEARELCGAVTSLMTARAYAMSATIAAEKGPYAAYADNSVEHLAVMGQHRVASHAMKTSLYDYIGDEADRTWDLAIQLGEEHGYRNAQATLLAPTGTIAFLMDCDTTGIEPDFMLVKQKELVGGGTMELINRSVPAALETLGYGSEERERMTAAIAAQKSAKNVVKDEELAVFDCANDISSSGHLRMMAAAQPFLSGAISKTVNLPHSATVEDVEQTYVEAWRLGIKALAIYRDGSKGTQAYVTERPSPKEDAAPGPVRRRLPATRQSITHKFVIDGHEGYITAGKYDDGSLGEVFVTVGKEGSTIAGLLDFAATLLSVSLQYGVPLEDLTHKFMGYKFEPMGITENPEIRTTSSMADYIMRWLASQFGDVDEHEALGILTEEVKRRRIERLSIVEEHGEMPEDPTLVNLDGLCECGGMLQPAGNCRVCSSCGTTTGCS